MPAYIHLVRHAQGFHNLSFAQHQLPDPDLTALGKEQCAELTRVFPHHDKITHLVASPLRRTLYTCLLSFAPAIAAGNKPVVALPEVQEVSDLPCDVGSEPEKLAEEFGLGSEYNVDLSRVAKGWNDKGRNSPWAPENGKLEARAKTARRWLRELAGTDAIKGEEEVHIVVVTHGGFLHFLTQDYDGLNPDQGTGWLNTECRTYQFQDTSGEDEEARLKETAGSWRKRRGSAIGLTETEQRELRAAAARYLEDEAANGSGNGKK